MHSVRPCSCTNLDGRCGVAGPKFRTGVETPESGTEEETEFRHRRITRTTSWTGDTKESSLYFLPPFETVPGPSALRPVRPVPGRVVVPCLQSTRTTPVQEAEGPPYSSEYARRGTLKTGTGTGGVGRLCVTTRRTPEDRNEVRGTRGRTLPRG